VAQLSARETQLLELAARGLTDEAIALTLQISVATVRGYWLRIRTKLGGSGRAELVAQWTQLNSDAETQRRTREYDVLTQANHAGYESALADERAAMDKLLKDLNPEQRAIVEQIRDRTNDAMSHVRDIDADNASESA